MEPSVDFPSLGILPKQETGALSFQSANPDYDGRGIVVAILDTGCDPGADGLQLTSDGRPKYLDVIDSTGSGDVDTSTQVTVASVVDNQNILISPITNNRLRLKQEWIADNKNAYFNVGAIRAYHFFPKPLRNRIEKQRNEKFGHKLAASLATLQRDIAAKTAVLQNAKKDEMSVDEQRALKDEIEDMRALYGELAKEKNSGAGPIFDVIVWFDGTQYNAVLNTLSMDKYANATPSSCLTSAGAPQGSSDAADAKSNEDDSEDSTVLVSLADNGDKPANVVYDLSSCAVLTNYRRSQKYGTISNETMLHYVLNVYDAGKLVSVVVAGGSHGTHVAGIVSAYYKDDASKNGVAPGAQIVSIKIGDTRLGTMETNQGLMRALYHIRENKCDLVNMSYGEPTTRCQTGCFPKGVESLVWKYGIMFVSSAGNAGPCLTTAGAPQGSTDAILGIGAMFSPQMVQSQYGLVQKGDDGVTVANHHQAYSWSSRGPTMDGAIGVKIMSPGGAIAPIPEYTLAANQLMNGTSMSSPNACGNIALLLSALKQQGLAYTPFGIETALINTANNDALSQVDTCARGYGLLQLHAAYNYCVKHAEFISSPVTHFEVEINGDNRRKQRGIYIRRVIDRENGSLSFGCSVTPKFREGVSNSVKLAYQFKCALKTDCPHWIVPAPFTLIASDGRSFEIRVDAYKVLQSSSAPVFRGYIYGYDHDNAAVGPLFRVPVTVCNVLSYPLPPSLSLSQHAQSNVGSGYVFRRRDALRTGSVARVFHRVPNGASAARVSIKCVSTKDDKQLRFVYASLYGKSKGEQVTYERWCRMKSGDELSTSLQRVEPNTVLETTMCQYALSFGESVVEWSVEFVGPSVVCNDNAAIAMSAGDQCGMLSLRTTALGCTDEANKINPVVKFDTLASYYSPQFATINKDALVELGDVDIANQDARVRTLELEYAFDQLIAGTKCLLRFMQINDLLYEATLEGCFWQLFDANKQLIGYGEAFDESTEIAKQKGYVLKLQLRSADVALLERYKGLVLRVDTVLTAKHQVTCDVYTSKLDLANGSGKVTSAFVLRGNSNCDLFFTAPNVKKLELKQIETGTQWLGYLKLNKDSKSELRPKFRSNGQRGSASLCIAITCNLIQEAKAAESRDKLPEIKSDDAAAEDADEDKKLSMEEKQRDAMVDWMSKKLKGDERKKAFEMFGDDLLLKYDSLPLWMLKLDIYKDDGEADQVMAIVDAILKQIDTTELAAFFGKKVVDKTDEKYKKESKKYKEQKTAVIEALRVKLATIKKGISSKSGDGVKDAILDFKRVSKEDLAPFEAVYKELAQWNDAEKDKKMFDLNLWYNLQKGLIAKALAMVNEKINGNGNGKEDKAVSKEQVEMKVKLYETFLPKQQWSFLTEQYALDIYKKYPADFTAF
eukprot:CAMPEP_0202729586 /NCGR_PEP_ID=MMETSP1385-20130828/186208_1 /ASSEMBLY_ACC=CAM_ASM_000861 /TAXON_ID=933848 /ORGANISM="Elphidium margaritaceum" /LENGTH=1403 /DNA_ID=CAMNT_0049395853 /DNA_START=43 /DNA_END=4254 /DNA_ORIENTATION=+